MNIMWQLQMAVNIPCLLYSVPGRTGVNIAPETVLTLSEHPNIVGIKEASGSITQVAEICRLVPDDFAVYSGNDDGHPHVLGRYWIYFRSCQRGTQDSVDMSSAALSGNWDRARELQLEMKPLIDSLFADVNPIPVKAAMHMMGKMELEYRLPLCPPSEAVTERIRREMSAYGLI